MICKQCGQNEALGSLNSEEDGLCAECWRNLQRGTKRRGSGRTMRTLESKYHSHADVRLVRLGKSEQ